MNCERVVGLDDTDYKSLDLLRKVLINLGYFYKKIQPQLAIIYFTRSIIDRPVRFKEVIDMAEATLQVAKIYYQIGEIDKAREHLSPKFMRLVREALKQRPNLQQSFQVFLQELS